MGQDLWNFGPARRVEGTLRAQCRRPDGTGGQTLAVDRQFGPGTLGANWLLTDHEQSLRRVIDDTASIVGDIAYDSFGNITSTDTPETLGTIVGYTGQQFDVETGLVTSMPATTTRLRAAS